MPTQSYHNPANVEAIIRALAAVASLGESFVGNSFVGEAFVGRNDELPDMPADLDEARARLIRGEELGFIFSCLGGTMAGFDRSKLREVLFIALTSGDFTTLPPLGELRDVRPDGSGVTLYTDKEIIPAGEAGKILLHLLSPSENSVGSKNTRATATNTPAPRSTSTQSISLEQDIALRIWGRLNPDGYKHIKPADLQRQLEPEWAKACKERGYNSEGCPDESTVRWWLGRR